VSHAFNLSVPVPTYAGLPRDKGVGFKLPVSEPFSPSPQTSDDQGLVVPPVL
jgi:hypothetical protein